MIKTTHIAKALQLKAKAQAHSFLLGNTLSKRHAEGYDFSQLREYQPGDDIRKINWMISAKLGKPYIKELHANRELSVVVATFMDASLYFGAGNDKQKKLCEIATLLGYATVYNNDLFRGFYYTENQSASTTPSKQPYSIEEFSNVLFGLPVLHTRLDFKVSLQSLFQSIHKPSLVFILGDFLEEVDLSLLAQKHEVIAIIVRDKDEESTETSAEVSLSNPYNDTKKEHTLNKKSLEKYLSLLKNQDKKRNEDFAKHNIRHLTIRTDEEVLAKLMPLFS